MTELFITILVITILMAIRFWPKRSPKRIYIVCPVRNVTTEQKENILVYVSGLEKKGYKVRLPFRDTDQTDDGIGLRIVEEHEKKDIIWADEIHIFWYPNSQGSLWDIAQARMAGYFKPTKIVFANLEDIQIVRNAEGKPTKSYNNVFLAMHYGLNKNSTGADLDKIIAESLKESDKSDPTGQAKTKNKSA